MIKNVLEGATGGSKFNVTEADHFLANKLNDTSVKMHYILYQILGLGTLTDYSYRHDK